MQRDGLPVGPVLQDRDAQRGARSRREPAGPGVIAFDPATLRKRRQLAPDGSSLDISDLSNTGSVCAFSSSAHIGRRAVRIGSSTHGAPLAELSHSFRDLHAECGIAVHCGHMDLR